MCHILKKLTTDKNNNQIYSEYMILLKNYKRLERALDIINNS